MTTSEKRIRAAVGAHLPIGTVAGHGYARSGRDYEVRIEVGETARCVYRFTDCHEVTCRTRVHDAACDELFSGYESWIAAGCPEDAPPARDAAAPPTVAYVRDSGLARHWSHLLDREMHEIEIDTGRHVIRLVCHDLVVSSLAFAPAAPMRSV